MKLFLSAIFVFLIFSAGNLYANDINECLAAYEKLDSKTPDICLPMAEGGNPQAQKIMGDIRYRGWGKIIPIDNKEALRWYKKAGSAGDINAKYNVGVMYEHGNGVPEDFEKAYKWYYSAAQKGHMAAQLNIANMYSKGAGIKQDYREAAKWYLRAAEQGDAIAQYNLANRYVRAQGVGSNAIEAYKWYILAEKRGAEEALTNREHLKLFMTQEQIEKAEQEAKSWYPKLEDTSQGNN